MNSTRSKHAGHDNFAAVEELMDQAVAQIEAGWIEKARISLRDAERMVASLVPPSRDWWADFSAKSGYVLHESGDYDAAVRRWQTALDIYRPHASNRSYTFALLWMAESLRCWGAIGAARDRCEALLAWSPRLAQSTRTTAERVIAMCDAMVGDMDLAIRRLERLAAADLPTQPTADRIGVCCSLGALQAMSDSHGLAVQWYRRALTIGGLDEPADRARTLLGLVSCLQDAGRNEEAATALRDAHAAVDAVASPTLRVELDLADAFQLLADGLFGQAQSRVRAILDRTRGVDGPDWRGLEARAHTLQARIARSENDYARAVEHLGAADRIEDGLSAFPHRRRRVLAALADAYDDLGRDADAERARATADAWPVTIRERSDRLSASVPAEKLGRPRTPLHRHVDLVVVAGIVRAVAAGAAIALR